MENNCLDIFNFSLLLLCTFKVTMELFVYVFWRMNYYCGINGSFPNVTFSASYFRHALFNWRLMFIDMAEYLQNCRVYRTNISNYFLNKYEIQKHRNYKTFYVHDVRWEIVIFLLHRRVIALLTKILIIYSKLISIYPHLLYILEIGCLRHVQNFNDVLEGVLIKKNKRV